MTSMVSGGRRKMHYTLPDDTEVVEEYDIQTDELVVRKKRGKTVLGAQGEWEYETMRSTFGWNGKDQRSVAAL